MVNITMQVVNSSLVAGKKVLLRYDIDVQITSGKVTEDFKLRAGLLTLKLCLQNAEQVILMGHVGRPEGKVVEELKVAPVVEWFRNQGYSGDLGNGKLKILENLRFDPREEAGDSEYAKELAGMGDVYINEAFSSYHRAVSTTILPTLLPHAAGLHFEEEVRVLWEVRENPKKPFVAIMGGAKVGDKLPVIQVLAKKADAVLVGGKLVAEIKEQNLILPKNVMVGQLSEDGFDIAESTVLAWENLIRKAKMIVWNGPLGRIEENTWKVSKDFTFQVEKLGSAKSTYEIAKMILNSHAQIVVGGGDTVAFLGSLGLLGEYEEKGFVSVGGGSMLKFLTDGTLPTIDALV